MTNRPVRLGVLLSGSGRTLQNFLDRIRQGTLPAEVKVVIASKPGVKGLDRAAEAGIDHEVVHYKNYTSPQEHSAAINAILGRYPIDLICLAGYMHLYDFPESFRGRVMNIHPALIPSFCGKGYYGHHVHEAVIASGVKVTGCTVHFVDEHYDRGPIVVQKTTPVLDDDTPDTVAERVFEKECEANPEAIRLFAEGRLKIEGRRVRVLPVCG
jgi:formyltetrahydrofolate-dependent phosphoribosylglycinamide formyltransferase